MLSDLTVAQIFKILRENEVKISLNEGNLRLNAKNDSVPSWLIGQIKANKNELIAFLEKNRANHVATVESQQNDKILYFETTFYQQREWLLFKIKKDKNFFNTQSFFESDRFSEVIFEKIFREVCKKNENLRSYFQLIDGELFQVVQPSNTLKIPLNYLDISAEINKSEALKKLTQQENETPFDFENELLFRITTYKLSEQQFITVFTAHHVITDNYSMKILRADIEKLYKSFSLGKESSILATVKQPRHFSQWQNTLAHAISPSRAYWQNELRWGILPNGMISAEKLAKNRQHRQKIAEKVNEKITALNLKKTPSIHTLLARYEAHNGGELKGILPTNCFKAIQSTAKKLQISTYSVILAVYSLTVYQLCQQKLIFVELPMRMFEDGYQNTFGWLPTSGFCSIEIDEKLTIEKFIQYTARRIIETSENSVFPAEALFDECGLKIEQGFPSIIGFIENQRPIDANVQAGFQEHRTENLIAYSEMFFTFGQYDDAIDYVLYYSRVLFEPMHIERFFKHFIELSTVIPQKLFTRIGQ